MLKKLRFNQKNGLLIKKSAGQFFSGKWNLLDLKIRYELGLFGYILATLIPIFHLPLIAERCTGNEVGSDIFKFQAALKMSPLTI